MLVLTDKKPDDGGMDDGSPGQRNQTSFAYERIRADIIAARHTPGERLNIADLCATLQFSPGAVREALSRLVSDKLVVSRDKKGFIVAPLSRTDLLDLTDIRCEIEEIALRRSVERGGIEWETAIIASAYRLNATPRVIDDDDAAATNPLWVESHAAFHAALVSACGSERILELHNRLYEQAERYRSLSTVGSKRDVTDEHSEIVDAAISRDARKLVELMTTHIELTTSRIIASVEQNA